MGAERDEPSLFEVTFLEGEVRFQYGFLASDECFLEEWLHAWPLGKKQILYERDCQDFKFGENLKGENKVIESLTRPNSLFLSAAVQNKHSQLTRIFSWFRDLVSVNAGVGRRIYLRGMPADLSLARLFESSLLDSRQQLLLASEGIDEPLLDRFRLNENSGYWNSGP